LPFASNVASILNWCSRHFCTSGFTRLGERLPSSAASRLSAASIAIRRRVSAVALPTWGIKTTFFISSRARETLGSSSKTSRLASAMRPPSRASTSAASSTMFPRAVLIKNAEGFIKASCGSRIAYRVSIVSGTCTLKKSESRKSVSESTNSAANSFSMFSGTLWRAWYRIRIEKPHARCATACAMRPNP